MTQIIKADMLGDLIQKLPKTDLHLHLDGSLRVSSIIDIAKQENIQLPSYDEDELNRVLFKDNYKNLEEYLTTFGYSCATLQNPENLERAAYELAIDNQNEGVRYIEVRFAPQLSMSKDMNMEAVMTAVNKGLERAQKEFNSRDEIRTGSEPEFNYGIIVCALRTFGPFSAFYSDFIDSLGYSASAKVAALASLELAMGAVKCRDELGIPIVALDLAGAEDGFPAKDHKEAFQFAHQNFLAKTVHAGEAYGPTSIFQAITELKAERIGHGFFLFDKDKVTGSKTEKREQFIESLCRYIAEHRITIEVCLTSNRQTMPELGGIPNHTFAHMLEHDLSTTLCTDNRTVSKTTVSQEIALALDNFSITPEKFKKIIAYGFKRSFFAGSYAQKRDYIKKCMCYYEQVTKGTPLEVHFEYGR